MPKKYIVELTKHEIGHLICALDDFIDKRALAVASGALGNNHLKELRRMKDRFQRYKRNIQLLENIWNKKTL